MGDTKEYYIYVQGKQVPVSHDIYCAYYEEYDHERYLDKRGRKREISFDLLQEQRKLVDFDGLSVCSPEYQMMEEERISQLHEALKKLSDEERWLIEKLYFDECSEHDVAVILGVSRQAVNKRKQRILKKLEIVLQ